MATGDNCLTWRLWGKPPPLLCDYDRLILLKVFIKIQSGP